MKQEPTGEFRRFEHAHRNDCWQGDMTGGFWLPNPVNPKQVRQCWLHAAIDDHTRYVPTARFYFRANLVCHCDCFRHGVMAGGKPSIFYTGYVPRNIIGVMCPTIICGQRAIRIRTDLRLSLA